MDIESGRSFYLFVVKNVGLRTKLVVFLVCICYIILIIWLMEVF